MEVKQYATKQQMGHWVTKRKKYLDTNENENNDQKSMGQQDQF